MKEKILAAIGIAVILTGLYLAFNTPPRQTIPEESPNTPGENVVTIRGKISCLPKLGSGAQTLECAIGLRDSEGKHYALKNLFENDPTGEITSSDADVEITGILSQEEMFGPDGNKYDISGVISVSSARKISD